MSSQVEAWGESKQDSPDEDDENDDDDGDDSEGMAARLDRILQNLPQTDVVPSHAGASKGPQGKPHDGRQKEASPRRPRATRPLLLPRVVPFLLRNSLQCLARDIGSKPW